MDSRVIYVSSKTDCTKWCKLADKTVYEYNTNNQVSSKTSYINSGQEQISQETYMYDKYGSLESESSDNGVSKSYVRDALGRLSSNREEVDGCWFQCSYNYSSTTGLPESKVYSFSSGGNAITENYIYQNGTLVEIMQDGQHSIWKLLSEDAFGHPTAVSTGSLNRTYSYYDYGFPTNRKSVNSSGAVIQDFGMLFDPVTGNLKARGDNKYNKFEQFRYDNLNRLTQVYMATSLVATPSVDAENVYSYLANGNLASKSDVGVFSYDNASKPYAVTGLGLIGDAVPPRSQQVTYTSFERPASIIESNYTALFSYNGSGERVKMNITRNNKTEILRYYLNGSDEADHTPEGDTERLYMGGDAYSAPAVLIKKNGSWNLYYICRDYLGSITQMTDSNGTLLQEVGYDAWGRLRNPNTLVAYLPNMEPELLLGRGYTGHEHLTMFGLVNMNARLYDPAVGRFLSPDPYVQVPDFTQSYNRFSYAMNNPLVYVDADGENPLLVFYYYNYHPHFQGLSLDPMVVLSTTLSGTSEVYYSKHFGTWMGKDFKVRSQSWGGNQYTGGKNKFAKQMVKKITWGGNVLGIYNGVNTYLDWRRGNSSSQQFLIEEFSNIYSTVGGVYGAAWGVGWEMGRQTTYQTWYQQLKYCFWYNRMENLIGPPSETNKIYWNEFYKNYRP